MLRGVEVGLRAVEQSDLQQLLEWRNKPEFRKFFREYRELNKEQQRLWFEKIVMNDRNTTMFSIIETTTNRLVGACGLCYIDWVNRNADFSIYIGADGLYIDEHYAFDAAKIMIGYGFEELNLHRLWAEIYDDDEPKKRLFQRLGFSLEGTHKQTHWGGGRWHDSLFFGLINGNQK